MLSKPASKKPLRFMSMLELTIMSYNENLARLVLCPKNVKLLKWYSNFNNKVKKRTSQAEENLCACGFSWSTNKI